ncbi:hypothetical protein J3A83DRAFT_249520 [Scleroderma citrinum]
MLASPFGAKVTFWLFLRPATASLKYADQNALWNISHPSNYYLTRGPWITKTSLLTRESYFLHMPLFKAHITTQSFLFPPRRCGGHLYQPSGI